MREKYIPWSKRLLLHVTHTHYYYHWQRHYWFLESPKSRDDTRGCPFRSYATALFFSSCWEYTDSPLCPLKSLLSSHCDGVSSTSSIGKISQCDSLLTIYPQIAVAVQQPYALRWSTIHSSPVAVALGKSLQKRSVSL